MNLPFAAETERCRSAQQSWARQSIRQRLSCVRKFRFLLVEAARELALSVTNDIGRSADEVLITDILPTADACRFLERCAGRVLSPARVPRSRRPLWLFGSRDTVHRRPHGLVAIIGTWNYPIFLNCVQIVQALAAGNGVIWKPSELTPGVAAKLIDLLHRAGFPRDLFIGLPATREAGAELAEADIDHLVFTGSADVGRRLASRLGERLISSTLELSGCDAMFVAADANLSMAAHAAWWGMTLNNGQTCLAVRRIFVESSVYSSFLEQLGMLAKSAYSRPLGMWQQAAQAERLVSEAIKQGARLLEPGATPRAENDPPRYPPTVIVDARPEMAICREASFAPVAAVVPLPSLADAIEISKQCPYALGASIFASNRVEAKELASRLGERMVTINDVIAPTAHPATPFGGRAASGWGATQGAEGLLAMTITQTVTERAGSFRPHYANDSVTQTATAALMHGLLVWRHAGSRSQRWSGFWQMMHAALRFPRGF